MKSWNEAEDVFITDTISNADMFYNKQPLGSVPEYCVKASVISENEESARIFLSKKI